MIKGLYYSVQLLSTVQSEVSNFITNLNIAVVKLSIY